MPPPLPPIVNDGRNTHGRPTRSRISWASASDRATPLTGTATPTLCIACLNFSRSSALSIASGVAPIISTLNLSSAPWHACVGRPLGEESLQSDLNPSYESRSTFQEGSGRVEGHVAPAEASVTPRGDRHEALRFAGRAGCAVRLVRGGAGPRGGHDQ